MASKKEVLSIGPCFLMKTGRCTLPQQIMAYVLLGRKITIRRIGEMGKSLLSWKRPDSR